MRNLSCVAIDDNQKALEVIAIHAARVPFLHLQGTFRSPLAALEHIKRQSTELVFLDIEMPDISGLKLAGILPSQTMLVFTTAYSEYAVESYELDAIDYLHKPIGFDRFLKAADRAQTYQTLLHPRSQGSDPRFEEFVDFKSGQTLHRVRLSDILYLEGSGNYVKVVCSDRSFLVYTSLYKAILLLPPEDFVRIHRSHIVSLLKVERADPGSVRVGGRIFRVGNKYASGLAHRLGPGKP